MLYQIRHSVFTRILCGLIGLHLLNVSVDTADPNPEYIPEDLSINDQESIIEIVLEKVLGYEDAIKEYDDQDTEDHYKKYQVKIDLMACDLPEMVLYHTFRLLTREKFLDYHALIKKGFQTLDTPPPRY